MNIYDILILIILLVAIYKGYSKGVILQLSGIVGILAGAWLAGRFSQQIAQWLGVESQSEILVYITVVIVVMIGVVMLLRLFNKVLHLGGLSFPVKILGVVTSVLKYVLVLALVQTLFLKLVSTRGDHKELGFIKDIRSSYSYHYLNRVSMIAYPYVSDLASMVYLPEDQQ